MGSINKPDKVHWRTSYLTLPPSPHLTPYLTSTQIHHDQAPRSINLVCTYLIHRIITETKPSTLPIKPRPYGQARIRKTPGHVKTEEQTTTESQVYIEPPSVSPGQKKRDSFANLLSSTAMNQTYIYSSSPPLFLQAQVQGTQISPIECTKGGRKQPR